MTTHVIFLLVPKYLLEGGDAVSSHDDSLKECTELWRVLFVKQLL